MARHEPVQRVSVREEVFVKIGGIITQHHIVVPTGSNLGGCFATSSNAVMRCGNDFALSSLRPFNPSGRG